MVTGDHRATGEAIARALGIARAGDEVDRRARARAPTDAALAARVERIAVYARVHPAQKLRIVDALQQRGEVVAMTGDGVNDAPALVQADIGVAMGRSGTEVAREAADMVLADDNFATIVAAVKEGRVVYRNIKKVILLLFSTSAAEVAVLVLAIVLGHPLPFTAVQILWNNLVTEGLIVVNLIMDPAEGDEMRRRPIRADEPLLTRAMRSRMAIMATTIVIVTLGWFAARITAGVPEAQARTETFTLLALCEWFNVLNCRSERNSALKSGCGAIRGCSAGSSSGTCCRLPSCSGRRWGASSTPCRSTSRSCSRWAPSPAWCCGSRNCASGSCAVRATAGRLPGRPAWLARRRG